MSGRERRATAHKAGLERAPRPRDAAALIIADPFTGRLLFAAGRQGPRLPVAALTGDDGTDDGPAPHISQARLGAPEARAPAFMDAALRAGFGHLGLLIARSCTPASGASGLWGRTRRHGLAPDRTKLTYLGRALSPTDAVERLHLRVFTAPLAAAANSLIGPETRADPVWLTPADAAADLKDPAARPFAERALNVLGSRARPIMVSFRSGQSRITAL